jgi:hypothetical protein
LVLETIIQEGEDVVHQHAEVLQQFSHMLSNASGSSLINHSADRDSSLPALPQTVVFAGEVEFLIRLASQAQRDIPPCRVVSLSRELGPAISRAACAYAVATLAAEKG